MKLNRSIKLMQENYDRDFAYIQDTDENISNNIFIEISDDENCCVQTYNWPEMISINASMTCVQCTDDIHVEMFGNGQKIGQLNIYSSPKIDSRSNIINPLAVCSKVLVHFESGKCILDGELTNFKDKDFAHYTMNFAKDTLFEKDFLTTPTSIREQYISKINLGMLLQHDGLLAKCKVYPYAGFFEYGCHPKNIESCVFRTVIDEKSAAMRISPLSAIRNSGADPQKDIPSDYGFKFVGVKEFSESNLMSLYDELITGLCGIQLTNNITNEKQMYKSVSVFHTEKTNLITINFIGENK